MSSDVFEDAGLMLLCRQGELAYQQLPSQAWETCHFVLTRSWWLHWFSQPDRLDTLDGLRLSRCQVHSLICTV